MLEIDSRMPAFWEEECEKQNLFLFTPLWIDVLRLGLSVKQFRYVHENFTPVALVSIFHKYSIRAAYINFPIGENDDSMTNPEHGLAEDLAEHCDTIRADILRSSNYQQGEGFLTRTIVKNIGNWNQESLSAATRRNIRKAEKSRVKVRDNSNINAAELYNFYRSVIVRNKGRIRYKPAYFEQLLYTSRKTEQLRILVASCNGINIGYLCFLRHKNTAYYLHGAIDMSHSKTRAMDYLFFQAISELRKENIDSFDMLASPQDQLSLVRYKEKWGGESFTQIRQTTYAKSLRGKLLNFCQI